MTLNNEILEGWHGSVGWQPHLPPATASATTT